MEADLKLRRMKFAVAGLSGFLVISFLAGIVQSADPLNGIYYSERGSGLTYYEIDYNGTMAKVVQRSRCGNCDVAQYVAAYGKPIRSGNTVKLTHPKNPKLTNGSFKVISNEELQFDITFPGDSAPTSLNFIKSHSGLPWTELLIRLGCPRSLLP
jgi:hypothetical protein